MRRLRGRKVTAFIILNLLLISIYFATLFIKPEILNIIGITIIITLFANCVTFIGGNTLDKWIASKYFRSELLNKDNDK